MRPDPLPPSLRELEDQLTRRTGPEPAADLRGRVLRAVAETVAPARPAGRRWRLLWQAAAAATLILNLGMSVSNGVRYQRLTAPASSERRAEAFESEDRFQAFAASALADITPAPDVGALGQGIFDNKEPSTWAS